MNTTTTKFTNDLLTKQITKLTEEVLKPMSILEIQEKFSLSFPFKVRRVRDSIGFGVFEVGHEFVIQEIKSETIKRHSNPQKHLVTQNMSESHHQSAEVRDYILVE